MKTLSKISVLLVPTLLCLGTVYGVAQQAKSLPFNGVLPIHSLVITPDGRYVARDSNWVGQLVVLDRKSQKTRSWHPSATNSGDVGAKGLIQLGSTPFVAGTADFYSTSNNSIGIYDLRNGNLRVIARHQVTKQSLVSTPDGRTIIAPYSKGGLAFWDVQTGKFKKNWAQISAPDALQISPNGNLLATAHYSRLYGPDASKSGAGGQRPQIWDLNSGRLKVTCQKVRKFPDAYPGMSWMTVNFSSLRFSPNGRLLATGSNGYGVVIWDATTGRNLWTLAHPENRTERGIVFSENGGDVAFSPDSKRVAAPGHYGTIDVYSVQNGKLLKQIKGGGPVVWTKEGLFFNGSQPRRPEGRLMLLKF